MSSDPYTLGAGLIIGPQGVIERNLADVHYRDYLAHIDPDFDLRAALVAAVTAKRWAVETCGITLPGGVQVKTGTDDQARITSVIAHASAAGIDSVDFKAASGWVTLSLAEVRSIATAVALHVQACFAAERAHHDAIEALADEELASYDLHAGWPGGED